MCSPGNSSVTAMLCLKLAFVSLLPPLSFDATTGKAGKGFVLAAFAPLLLSAIAVLKVRTISKVAKEDPSSLDFSEFTNTIRHSWAISNARIMSAHLSGGIVCFDNNASGCHLFRAQEIY